MTAADVHQLQIVDDDQTEFVTQSAAFRLDLRNRDGRIVVHIDIQSCQYAGRTRDLYPIVTVQIAGFQLLRLNERLTRQETAGQLFLAHLKLEHAHAGAFFVAALLILDTCLSRIERHVERKCGLAHAGSCRNENQVGFIETCQRRVQRVEAGGHAGNFTVRPGTLVQFGIQISDNLRKP